MRAWMPAALSGLLACAVVSAQSPGSLDFTVSERAGIRRTRFPVSAVVRLPAGTLSDPGHVRLLLGDAETPAQVDVASRWSDGSVQALDVAFNASIDALASVEGRLEYGPAVLPAPVTRGLTVTEDAESIQIGNVRLSKAGRPLLLSVKYRDEDVAEGANGLRATARDGSAHDLADAAPPSVAILKRGPLLVAVRYTGTIALDARYAVPFTLDVEMPNSKSWMKLSATIRDPEQRVREVSIDTPLSLGPFPWVWDLGTDRGTYGAFRRASDAMVFRQEVDDGTASWDVQAGEATGSLRVVETTGARRAPPARWVHFQSAGEAVAFAIDGVGDRAGTYRVALNASGQTSFGFASARPADEQRLVLFEHFVSTPVAIGAATSAAAALSPLEVSFPAPTPR